MSTSAPTRNIPTASRIIARASASILMEKPRYTRQDQHDLAILKQYGF